MPTTHETTRASKIEQINALAQALPMGDQRRILESLAKNGSVSVGFTYGPRTSFKGQPNDNTRFVEKLKDDGLIFENIRADEDLYIACLEASDVIRRGYRVEGN